MLKSHLAPLARRSPLIVVAVALLAVPGTALAASLTGTSGPDRLIGTADADTSTDLPARTSSTGAAALTRSMVAWDPT